MGKGSIALLAVPLEVYGVWLCKMEAVGSNASRKAFWAVTGPFKWFQLCNEQTVLLRGCLQHKQEPICCPERKADSICHSTILSKLLNAVMLHSSGMLVVTKPPVCLWEI